MADCVAGTLVLPFVMQPVMRCYRPDKVYYLSQEHWEAVSQGYIGRIHGAGGAMD